MDTIKRYYFLTLAFFPLFQFITYEYIDGFSFTIFYGAVAILLYFLLLFSGVNFNYNKYIFPLGLLAFYYLCGMWLMEN